MTLMVTSNSPLVGAQRGESIDWIFLRQEAQKVAYRAYAPYSQLHVGAAALTIQGRLLLGCNVENISYGLTLCAECAIISQLYSGGGGSLSALSCRDQQGNIISPCGRCRQLLIEHAHQDMYIDTPTQPRLLSELLPDPFTSWK